ncbi:hypothetical protein ACI2K6_10435 [Microbacterium sp. NPDC006705]|uniref:hypothetical protein n=1 Tax=Microbacterium sp. NPDC006705 TaxID=3364181 RepID=UPI0038506D04
MKRLTAPAIALLTLLAVAGCAPEPDAAAGMAASPVSPSPTAPAYVSGEVIDAATAEVMAADYDGPQRGYPMPDGSYVVVDRAAPLPDAVQQDVNVRGEALMQQFPRVEDATGSAAGAARSALISDLSAQTGKQVVLVNRTDGFDYYENPVTGYWTLGAYRTPSTDTVRSREEVAALIAEFMAGQNPDDYVVVWPN